jgi:hypothetical protein
MHKENKQHSICVELKGERKILGTQIHDLWLEAAQRLFLSGGSPLCFFMFLPSKFSLNCPFECFTMPGLALVPVVKLNIPMSNKPQTLLAFSALVNSFVFSKVAKVAQHSKQIF